MHTNRVIFGDCECASYTNPQIQLGFVPFKAPSSWVCIQQVTNCPYINLWWGKNHKLVNKGVLPIITSWYWMVMVDHCSWSRVTYVQDYFEWCLLTLTKSLPSRIFVALRWSVSSGDLPWTRPAMSILACLAQPFLLTSISGKCSPPILSLIDHIPRVTP